LSALDAVRRLASDTAIRLSLMRWARERVAADLGDDRALDRSLWSLETVLACSSEPAALDVTVAKLASPLLDGVRGLPEAIARVEELLRTGQTSPQPSPTQEASNSPSPGLARLLAAASPASPEVHALLPRCEVHVSDSEVTVIAPDELVPALTPHVPALRTAAGRLGLPLKLRKRSSVATGA